MEMKQTNYRMETTDSVLIKKDEHKLLKILSRYAELLTKKKNIEKEYQDVVSETLQTFKELKVDSYTLFSDDDYSSAMKTTFTKAKRTSVSFDYEMLKKCIGVKVANLFVDKTYSITDFEKFKAVMKEYDIPFEKVKNYIEIKEQVNTNKLQKAFEKEELELEKIKDCYTLNVTEYMTVRDSKV